MAFQTALTGVTSSQKRPADDGFNPLTSPISLQPTPPYDPKNEQAPFSVVQSKEYETYKAYEEHIKQLLTEPFTNTAQVDSYLEGVVDTVNGRTAGYELQKIIICLAGLMGTGKSATLNSLLGVLIAREGDHGGSCTLASCMYQGSKRGQAAAFLAEVNFFRRKDRREILATYLADYYHATHDDVEDDEPARKSQLPHEEAETNLDIRNEVVTAMFSLFGEQRGCRTRAALEEFLGRAESPDDETILGQLYAWCDHLIAKATTGNAVVTVTASTAEELSQKLEDYTKYAEDDSGDLAVSLTPMVSLINFHFDNPLARLGVTFLDTPGTSDRNRARRKSAQEYRKLRTHCAVVSEESRVKDDSGVLKEVALLKGRGPGRSVIVITRSDIINDSTMPPGTRKDKEQSEQLKKRVGAFKKELNAIEIQELSAAASGDMVSMGKVALDKTTLEIRIKLVENAERAHRIRMRSESNKKVLQEKLQSIPLHAHIFSVSNTEYAKHLQGYGPKEPPVLSVESTNIPALRRLFATFPNQARLNEIKHQQNENLSGLLERVRMYIEDSPSDRKEQMEEHINSATKRYTPEINEEFGRLDGELLTLLNSIKEQEHKWTKLAGGLCDMWAREFSTGVFLNLLKRDGYRKGRGRSREVDLSAELIHIVSEDMDELFRKIGARLRSYEGDIAERTESLVSDMIAELRGDPNESLMALGPFYDLLYSEKAKFRTWVKLAFDRIIEGLDDIRAKLTSENEDAYLVEAMLPIYNQVRQLKTGNTQAGPRPKAGWPAYRRVIFRNEVTKLNGLWAAVCSGVESDYQNILKTERERFIEMIGTAFADFHKSFNALCKVDLTDDPETAKILKHLETNYGKALEILNGPMQQAFTALEGQFRGKGAHIG